MNIINESVDNWTELNKIDLFNLISRIKNKINSINELSSVEKFIFLTMYIVYIRM